MKKIIWKDIIGYEGLYQISNYGDVKSLQNYRKYNVLKPRLKKGYLVIGLRKNNVRKWYSIHRLVAQAFIANPNNYPCVNHKDENKLNNCVDNLEWCTVKYNNCYGSRLKKVSEKNKLRKEICQFDLNNCLIATYKSLAEASKITNTNISCISKCINNKAKQSNNFIWKIKSEVM